jgi:hypothetical protein
MRVLTTLSQQLSSKAGVRCRIEETKREKQRWAPDKLQQCKMRKTELKGFFNVWV